MNETLNGFSQKYCFFSLADYGRTKNVLLDFENTITDKAKPVIGYSVYNHEENTISPAAECDLYKHLRTYLNY